MSTEAMTNETTSTQTGLDSWTHVTVLTGLCTMNDETGNRFPGSYGDHCGQEISNSRSLFVAEGSEGGSPMTSEPFGSILYGCLWQSRHRRCSRYPRGDDCCRLLRSPLGPTLGYYARSVNSNTEVSKMWSKSNWRHLQHLLHNSMFSD